MHSIHDYSCSLTVRLDRLFLFQHLYCAIWACNHPVTASILYI